MVGMMCAGVLIVAGLMLIPCWCCYLRIRHAREALLDLEEVRSDETFVCRTSSAMRARPESEIAMPSPSQPGQSKRHSYAYPVTPMHHMGPGLVWGPVGAAPAPVRQVAVFPAHLKLHAPAIIYEFNTLSGVRMYI
ncbi:hypothetical protein EXIGLDRAFT_719054 [Exidia glandulosa HHB12029]|uniref:Uncharacterized protein n=1 Tax=Exidia glandulosa HHB12029 TaxID=1314781 RepID=A0A165HC81_EXIGL|nr:hypothetical protein EXIGLDRAFT_719054 [Exidia glandulosa HHB12029]